MNADQGLTIRERVITTGRAYVRLIDSANLLLERDPVWTERMLLRLVRSLYTHRLRALVALLPAGVTSEILAASDRMVGPVGELSKN